MVGERWRRKERKDCARFLTTTWVSNTTCTMKKGLHTLFNLSVEAAAKQHTTTRLQSYSKSCTSQTHDVFFKESAKSTVVVVGRQRGCEHQVFRSARK